MGAIEQTIANAVRIGIADAVKPLNDKIDAMCKIIEKNNPPLDVFIKQTQLPQHLGSIGITKVKELCKHQDSPKPNYLGLYSLNAWIEYLKKQKKAA